MIIDYDPAQRDRLIKLGLCCDLARLSRVAEHAQKRLGRPPDTMDELTSKDYAAIAPPSLDEVNRLARAFSLDALRKMLGEERLAHAEQTADRMLAERARYPD